MKQAAISFGAGLAAVLLLGALPRGEAHIPLTFLIVTSLWWLLALASGLVLIGRLLAKFRKWPEKAWNRLLGPTAAAWGGITIGMLLTYGW